MEHKGRFQWLTNLLFGGSFKAYQQRTLTLLLLALTVDYGERTLIGAMGPTLERVFHFGNTTLGFLAAASGIVAALATIPFGILTDRISRTLLLAVSLLIWAVAAGVTGASVTIAMFFGAAAARGGRRHDRADCPLADRRPCVGGRARARAGVCGERPTHWRWYWLCPGRTGHDVPLLALGLLGARGRRCSDGDSPVARA